MTCFHIAYSLCHILGALSYILLYLADNSVKSKNLLMVLGVNEMRAWSEIFWVPFVLGPKGVNRKSILSTFGQLIN
jgi:hypothetical protein